MNDREALETRVAEALHAHLQRGATYEEMARAALAVIEEAQMRSEMAEDLDRILGLNAYADSKSVIEEVRGTPKTHAFWDGSKFTTVYEGESPNGRWMPYTDGFDRTKEHSEHFGAPAQSVAEAREALHDAVNEYARANHAEETTLTQLAEAWNAYVNAADTLIAAVRAERVTAAEGSMNDTALEAVRDRLLAGLQSGQAWTEEGSWDVLDAYAQLVRATAIVNEREVQGARDEALRAELDFANEVLSLMSPGTRSWLEEHARKNRATSAAPTQETPEKSNRAV